MGIFNSLMSLPDAKTQFSPHHEYCCHQGRYTSLKGSPLYHLLGGMEKSEAYLEQIQST